jgi:hypothetical protein
LRQGPYSAHDCKRDRKIENGAIFSHLYRSKIDEDLIWRIKASSLQSRQDSIPGFANRGASETQDSKFSLFAFSDANFNLDGNSVETHNATGTSGSKHEEGIERSRPLVAYWSQDL